jgi:glycosyltransferase involved in cell wall biosynthesis
VGDYTAGVAAALARAGCVVHVWAPVSEASPRPGGVALHPVGGFGPRGLAALSRALDREPRPRTLLVQYAPRAFGMQGMNAAFCLWVLGRARAGDDVRVMFHEPFFPFGVQPLRRNALAAVNRGMAWTLLRAARRWYVSIPAWAEALRPLARRGSAPPVWTPIPSTIPRVDDPEGVRRTRARLGAADAGTRVLGHFGTYGGLIAQLLAPVLQRALARDPALSVLLLGSGGPEFAASLQSAHPEVRGRLAAPGYLTDAEVSLHLQACDVAVQPYPDGASSRRTTLMAALCNGVATVTTTGALTEELWARAPVSLAPAHDPAALAEAVSALLAGDDARRDAGERGRVFYQANFSMERTLHALLGAEPGSTGTP